MAATSLKLPEDLKRRIERLATIAGKSPHAFMVEMLAREVGRAERREQIVTHAARSEKEVMEAGNAFGLSETFDYLAARIAGKKARRPRARSWRASK